MVFSERQESLSLLNTNHQTLHTVLLFFETKSKSVGLT